jgi:hypothetical protein
VVAHIDKCCNHLIVTGDSLTFALFVIALAGEFAATATERLRKGRPLALLAIFAVCVVAGVLAFGYQEVASIFSAALQLHFYLPPDRVIPTVTALTPVILVVSWPRIRRNRDPLVPVWRYLLGGICDLNAASYSMVLVLFLWIDSAYAIQILLSSPFAAGGWILYSATAPVLRFIDGRSHLSW